MTVKSFGLTRTQANQLYERQIAATTTAVSTTAVTTEEDLWSVVIPANTLSANGKAIRISIGGTCAATANTKTLRLRFGAAAVYTINPTTSAPSGVSWTASFLIMRSGANAQTVIRGPHTVGAVPQAVAIVTATETDTAPITVRVTGQNGTAAAGDITFSIGLIEVVQ